MLNRLVSHELYRMTRLWEWMRRRTQACRSAGPVCAGGSHGQGRNQVPRSCHGSAIPHCVLIPVSPNHDIHHVTAAHNVPLFHVILPPLLDHDTPHLHFWAAQWSCPLLNLCGTHATRFPDLLLNPLSITVTDQEILPNLLCVCLCAHPCRLWNVRVSY